MKHQIKLAIVTAVMVLLGSAQAFAGSWKLYGANYTYYDGTPGNPGAVLNAEVRESSYTGEYTLLIDKKTAENRWVGAKREGETEILWCYFGKNGKECSGWTQVDGSWYYLGGGLALSGWHRLDQKYYYFDPVTYAMRTSGTEMRDGIEYEFDSDGVSHVRGGLKNAGESGTEGWKQENGKWYYLRDGQKVVSQWLQNGNDKYYVGADGERCSGWHEIDGVLYHFRQDGIMNRNMTMYDNDHKYVLDADGQAADVAMTAEEKMEYSNVRKWCQSSYAIYTESQKNAEMAAHINGWQIPDTAELLLRDWGITTREQCVDTINRLAAAGRAGGTKSEKAWNFSRAMHLCESMQTMGWVTLAERLDLQLAIAPDIQSAFTSWRDYNEAYMAGFRDWADDPAVVKGREYAYESLKKSSVYFQVDWNQPLGKTW